MNTDTKIENRKAPWNKGKLVGQKLPLKLKEIWAIRIHLQLANRIRELALFNLAIDSKLRGCDLVELHVRDITQGNQVAPRAIIMQRKTHRPVQFELTEQPLREAKVYIPIFRRLARNYFFLPNPVMCARRWKRASLPRRSCLRRL
ncbi:MAG: hypothetical protein Q8O64_06225 [Sideroxyarcus sp.]|nr:hypothetical protein [Sideroxyarcus sp.]